MICPVCKKPMVTLELQNVEIDHCFECGGIWLDEGELEMLIDSENYRQRLDIFLKNAYFIKEKKRKCPICNKKMKKKIIGEKKILIDICPVKHGLWFDSGELLELLSFDAIDPDNNVLKLLKKMFKHKLEVK